MKLVVTADLHFNHARGREAALKAADEISRTPGDALLVIGDTAVGDGHSLEESLAAIHFDGPKLFLAGNHELWTGRGDSYSLFTDELPRRVRNAGWHWLEDEPAVFGDTAVVGSIGWYDYSFAEEDLGIPRRFYEAKVSPGAAERLAEFHHLLGEDVPSETLDIVVRWNDAKHIKLGRSDAEFLEERLARLRASLAAVSTASRVIAAVHHVPFRELLPRRVNANLDFVRAYLGSPKLGEALLADTRVSHVLCGHSHSHADVKIGHLRAVNVGSTYVQKRVMTLSL
ncbi:MAG: metallophosphoesterase [Tepidisphaeraceae bacterium]